MIAVRQVEILLKDAEKQLTNAKKVLEYEPDNLHCLWAVKYQQKQINQLNLMLHHKLKKVAA